MHRTRFTLVCFLKFSGEGGAGERGKTKTKQACPSTVKFLFSPLQSKLDIVPTWVSIVCATEAPFYHCDSEQTQLHLCSQPPWRRTLPWQFVLAGLCGAAFSSWMNELQDQDFKTCYCIAEMLLITSISFKYLISKTSVNSLNVINCSKMMKCESLANSAKAKYSLFRSNSNLC